MDPSAAMDAFETFLNATEAAFTISAPTTPWTTALNMMGTAFANVIYIFITLVFIILAAICMTVLECYIFPRLCGSARHESSETQDDSTYDEKGPQPMSEEESAKAGRELATFF